MKAVMIVAWAAILMAAGQVLVASPSAAADAAWGGSSTTTFQITGAGSTGYLRVDVMDADQLLPTIQVRETFWSDNESLSFTRSYDRVTRENTAAPGEYLWYWVEALSPTIKVHNETAVLQALTATEAIYALPDSPMQDETWIFDLAGNLVSAEALHEGERVHVTRVSSLDPATDQASAHDFPAGIDGQFSGDPSSAFDDRLWLPCFNTLGWNRAEYKSPGMTLEQWRSADNCEEVRHFQRVGCSNSGSARITMESEITNYDYPNPGPITVAEDGTYLFRFYHTITGHVAMTWFGRSPWSGVKANIEIDIQSAVRVGYDVYWQKSEELLHEHKEGFPYTFAQRWFFEPKEHLVGAVLFPEYRYNFAAISWTDSHAVCAGIGGYASVEAIRSPEDRLFKEMGFSYKLNEVAADHL